MAYEKKLKAVPARAFIANGTNLGKLTVVDTHGFKVKQVVVLQSTTQGSLPLEVKRVESLTVMYVGPIGTKITDRSDVSSFTTADTSTVRADEQNRPNVPEQEVERITYEEEPTMARRVTLVDPMGDQYDIGNPIPVSVDTTVNIGDVRITAQDNDPNLGNIHSSVRISDGIDELAINPDGSINVVIPPGAGGIPVNEFSQISSVPAAALTTILTYMVSPPYTGTLFRVEVGGNNVATYEIYINGSIEARLRTWFSTSLTQVFEFSSGASGFKLTTGDIVEVKVIHNRPFVGDFEARLQAQLQ